MGTRARLVSAVSLIVLAALVANPRRGDAVGTIFTYQGQLTQSGTPVAAPAAPRCW
jgi:hypothetical protein